MVKSKVISVSTAISFITDGMSVMLGGFGGVGLPYKLIEEISKSKLKDLHLIGNDAGRYGTKGMAQLFEPNKVKKYTTTYINGNRHASDLALSGELELELVPMGTLIERIRCAGAGLGGFLTPTGYGTEVSKGKKIISVDGKDYLLEYPIKADVALVRGWKADESGNIIYRRLQKNYCTAMAMAADLVIAEVEEIVPVGELSPDEISSPSVCIDYLVLV